MIYNIEWVREQFDRKENLKFIFFWGHMPAGNDVVGKFVFSQWYHSPFEFEGRIYNTAEHWMMARKALLFDDGEIFEAIAHSTKPGEAKELGRKIKNFSESKWNAHKYQIVVEGNLLKFDQNLQLKKFLKGTGERIIVEASPVDPIWGIGLAHDFKGIENPHHWRGENLLGFALMEVRDALK